MSSKEVWAAAGEFLQRADATLLAASQARNNQVVEEILFHPGLKPSRGGYDWGRIEGPSVPYACECEDLDFEYDEVEAHMMWEGQGCRVRYNTVAPWDSCGETGCTVERVGLPMDISSTAEQTGSRNIQRFPEMYGEWVYNEKCGPFSHIYNDDGYDYDPEEDDYCDY